MCSPTSTTSLALGPIGGLRRDGQSAGSGGFVPGGLFASVSKLDPGARCCRFPGWLMMIARDASPVGDGAAATASRGRPEEIETPVVTPDANDEEIQQMLSVIRQLPPKERMALHLFYLAEQPAELTARKTCRTPNRLTRSAPYKV